MKDFEKLKKLCEENGFEVRLQNIYHSIMGEEL